jgi:hypothetical protein
MRKRTVFYPARRRLCLRRVKNMLVIELVEISDMPQAGTLAFKYDEGWNLRRARGKQFTDLTERRSDLTERRSDLTEQRSDPAR